jgi:hypothetical protein
LAIDCGKAGDTYGGMTMHAPENHPALTLVRLPQSIANRAPSL